MLALLEGHLARLGVEVRTGCTVQTLARTAAATPILCKNAEGQDQPCGPMPSSAPWAAMPGRSSAPTASAPDSPPSAAESWSGCTLPDRPADSKAHILGRHPGQGRCHPAGPRPPLPRGCGKRRGAVHGLRAFGHLHHAAVRPSGPGAGPKRPLSWTSSPCWMRLP